jgi:hypothetical protein
MSNGCPLSGVPLAHSVRRGLPLLFRPSLLNNLKMLANVSHEKDCFVFGKEGRIADIIDRDWELKSAFCLIKEFAISVECKAYLFVILHHVFDASHIYSQGRGVN